MMELLGIPAWIEAGAGLIGVGFALGGFARARRHGWRGPADRMSSQLFLLTGLGVSLTGILRWMTGPWFVP